MDIFVPTRSKYDYLKVKTEANKPVNEREKIIKSNRGNIKIPRKYHLSENRLKQLKDIMTTGVFPNPYRRTGIYYSFIQALINLGVNKKHTFVAVKMEMKKIMSQVKDKNKMDDWTKFEGKTPNSSFCGKDVNGRIIQNAKVLQRISGVHVYGERLRELDACVDIYKDTNGLPLFMLRTNCGGYDKVDPLNEFKGNY
jgi:hypothetical protein